jgi:hypothetical protein
VSGHRVIALVLIGLGGLGLVSIFACNESVEGFLNDRCARGAVERDPNGNRARTFTCRDKPAKLAADLTKSHKPADERTTPEGHFLRYSDDMVGIVPAAGAKAYLGDERGGYAFFGPYVGGWWGSYGGRGETFRGGGPAGGK